MPKIFLGILGIPLDVDGGRAHNGSMLPVGDLELSVRMGMADLAASALYLAGGKEGIRHYGYLQGIRPARLPAHFQGLENREGRHSGLRKGLRVEGLADPHSREVVLT